MGEVTVYSGVERRRRWSDTQKRALIDAAFALDAIVAEVARAADVRPSQIYRWRRDLYSNGHADAGFAPVVVSAEPRVVAPASSPPPGDADRDQWLCRADRGGRAGKAGDGCVAVDGAVIPVPGGVRIWLATGHTDMRKGMYGLVPQVQQGLRSDPHAGDLYAFRGRTGDLVKILCHSGLGTSLYAERLDRDRFVWPTATDSVVAISASQIACMLEGIDWRNPQHTWRPSAAE